MLLIVVLPLLGLTELRVLRLELDVLDFLRRRLPRRSETQIRDAQPVRRVSWMCDGYRE